MVEFFGPAHPLLVLQNPLNMGNICYASTFDKTSGISLGLSAQGARLKE